VLYNSVRDRRALLEDALAYRCEFGLPLQNAIRELGQYEAIIRNDSEALQGYLALVLKQHRYVRLAWMAGSERTGRGRYERVFVMPRLPWFCAGKGHT
jgi:hypothetical protein